VRLPVQREDLSHIRLAASKRRLGLDKDWVVSHHAELGCSFQVVPDCGGFNAVHLSVFRGVSISAMG
jgi:hypothetical protein